MDATDWGTLRSSVVVDDDRLREPDGFLKDLTLAYRESETTCVLLGWRLGGMITGLVWVINDGSGGETGRRIVSLWVVASDFRESGIDRGVWDVIDALSSFVRGLCCGMGDVKRKVRGTIMVGAWTIYSPSEALWSRVCTRNMDRE
jgi:hypothetical protein